NGVYGVQSTVSIQTDEDRPSPTDVVLPLLWAAWRFTGNPEYLLPTRDEGPSILELLPFSAPPELGLSPLLEPAAASPSQSMRPGALHLAWQATGNVRFLEQLYAAQVEEAALREYINTEGSLWIDRVFVPSRELQRARLGGIALSRNSYF